MLSFFPRGVLDEILNLIESVSEEFPSYSTIKGDRTSSFFFLWAPGLYKERVLYIRIRMYAEKEPNLNYNTTTELYRIILIIT